jgi:geranylgeranyl diphosphate synthase type I
MFEELLADLDETSKAVNTFIERVICEQSDPRELHLASGHLLRAGGKRLRPFLLTTCCKLLGGTLEKALPTAASVELLHSFTLIHDDIMDQDNTRRGVPTVHTLYGVPMAITSGDLLFAKVYDTIIRYSDRKAIGEENILRILQTLTEGTIAICVGQALDVLFERRDNVSEEEYMHMIGGKTAALFRSSAEAGAIIAGGKPEDASKLCSYAYKSGLAFQIVDDILGLTGNEKTLGKPVGSDIRDGKRTLIVIYSLRKCSGDERGKILSVLGNRNATAEEVAEVIGIMRSLNSIEYARRRAEAFVDEAIEDLEPFPESDAKRKLLDLARFFIARES